ncbi:MAG TPA: hypothetical protein PKA19_09540 [Bacillota bacterium]|nr:hypothetical protein [Bacillota bacterium]
MEATIAFIKTGDFEIELFEYKEPRDLPKDRRDPDEDLKTVGTKHVAFYTSNYAEMMDHFKKMNVDIVFDKVMEGNPTCYIRDNSGVLIEFIEKH